MDDMDDVNVKRRRNRVATRRRRRSSGKSRRVRRTRRSRAGTRRSRVGTKRRRSRVGTKRRRRRTGRVRRNMSGGLVKSLGSLAKKHSSKLRHNDARAVFKGLKTDDDRKKLLERINADMSDSVNLFETITELSNKVLGEKKGAKLAKAIKNGKKINEIVKIGKGADGQIFTALAGKNTSLLAMIHGMAGVLYRLAMFEWDKDGKGGEIDLETGANL
jgi:hypothetical protein